MFDIVWKRLLGGKGTLEIKCWLKHNYDNWYLVHYCTHKEGGNWLICTTTSPHGPNSCASFSYLTSQFESSDHKMIYKHMSQTYPKQCRTWSFVISFKLQHLLFQRPKLNDVDASTCVSSSLSSIFLVQLSIEGVRNFH